MVRKCIEENCNTYANFNLINEKVGIYCKIHKKANMINLNILQCNQEFCKKSATFNYILISSCKIAIGLFSKAFTILVISKLD